MQQLDEVCDRIERCHEPQCRAGIVDEEEYGGEPDQYPCDDGHLVAHVVGNHVQRGKQEGAAEAHHEHQDERHGQEEQRHRVQRVLQYRGDGDQDDERDEQYDELLDHVGEDLHPPGYLGLRDIALVVVEHTALDGAEERGHREHSYREVVPEMDLGVEGLDLGEHQPYGDGQQYGQDEVPLDPDETVLISALEIPLDHRLEGQFVLTQLLEQFCTHRGDIHKVMLKGWVWEDRIMAVLGAFMGVA